MSAQLVCPSWIKPGHNALQRKTLSFKIELQDMIINIPLSTVWFEKGSSGDITMQPLSLTSFPTISHSSNDDNCISGSCRLLLQHLYEPFSGLQCNCNQSSLMERCPCSV